MSYKTIASYLGKILLLSAFFYIVPCLVALIYGEYAQIPALAAASLVALAAGGVLLLSAKRDASSVPRKASSWWACPGF